MIIGPYKDAAILSDDVLAGSGLPGMLERVARGELDMIRFWRELDAEFAVAFERRNGHEAIIAKRGDDTCEKCGGC